MTGKERKEEDPETIIYKTGELRRSQLKNYQKGKREVSTTKV